MNRELSSILTALLILAIGFGVWFYAQSRGLLLTKTADDVVIEKAEDGIFYLQWKNPSYGISGFSTSNNGDSILYIELDITKASSPRMKMDVDTVNIRYLNLYGKTIPLRSIPMVR